jgi:glycosyltransferase involved in cell wall biosynthesis
MIIAIDGYEANVSRRVGIGRYAYEILRYIYKFQSANCGTNFKLSKFIFQIYLPEKPLPDMPEETEWWRYRIAKPKKFWTFIGFPFALLVDRPQADVVFSPTHYIPRFTSIPKVMAIMDTSYLAYPGMFRVKDLYKLTTWTRFAVSHVIRIITISQFSKNAIIQAYHVSQERVVVTYPGLTMTNESEFNIFTKYGISRYFILTVGTIQPRKNYQRLIEAFSLFLKRNKQKFGEIQLVIIGKKGWLYDEILHAPATYDVADRVKFLHTVPDSDLPHFYKNALCLALSSLYEGFGLPVLEAMACNCPVVVSNVSSLPEIAGPAGVYVDPKDTESIAQGLLTAVRQRNLMQGKLRIEKGLSQVKKFTWEKAAEQTLAILSDVAANI